MSTGTAYVRTARALWRRVGGELLITAPEGSDVDRLSGPASTAWLLLERPLTADELTRSLASGFSVDATEIRDRVTAILEQLESRGWVVRVDADG